MLELANDLTAQGLFVVLDATFAQKTFRCELINWAKNTKIILNFVQCCTPESVLIQRLKNRSHDVSDATEDLLPSQKLSFDTICHDKELSLLSWTQPKIGRSFASLFSIEITLSLQDLFEFSDSRLSPKQLKKSKFTIKSFWS